MSKDGKSHERGEGEERVSLFAALAQEYGDVLTCFAGLRSEETPGREKINSLREKLFEKVFCYEAAVEMAQWGLEAAKINSPAVTQDESAKLTPDERLGSRRDDPWHRFAELEFEQGSLWIELLWYSLNHWSTVRRFESVADLGDSVFGRLMTVLGKVENDRLKGSHPSTTLEERFREARGAAWKVVVEETRKRMLGNEKPGRASYEGGQVQFDLSAARLSESFIEFPSSLRERLGSPTDRLVQKLDERLEGSSAVGHRKRGRTPQTKEKFNEIAPTKELMAGLLWTSADLPLCFMAPSAAAKAVLAILLSGVNSKVLGEDGSLESFKQSFSQLPRDRGLQFFKTHFPQESKPVRMISDFIMGRDSHDAPTWENPLSFRNQHFGDDVSGACALPEVPLNEEIREDHTPEYSEEPNIQIAPNSEEFKRGMERVRRNFEKASRQSHEEQMRQRLTRQPDSSMFAIIKFRSPYTGSGFEEIRFRFHPLGVGMIHPEYPPPEGEGWGDPD